MSKGWFARGTFFEIVMKQALIFAPLVFAFCLYASSHFKIKFNFLPLPGFVGLATLFLSVMEARGITAGRGTGT